MWCKPSSSSPIQFTVTQPLPDALIPEGILNETGVEHNKRATAAAALSEWLGSSTTAAGSATLVEDAQKHLASKVFTLEPSHVDPKDREKRHVEKQRRRTPRQFKLSKRQLKDRGLLDISQDNLTYNHGLILNSLWR